MNCFCTTQTNSASDSCCRANELCSFSGNLDDVTATPIYVQSVYDAVRFNLQGMRTVQNLKFTPSIPCGCSISRVIDIRIKKVFDPGNASDCNNLTLEMETGISGASFVNNSCGVVETIGPDGVPSEKLLFADTSECDSTGCRNAYIRHSECKALGQCQRVYGHCHMRQLRQRKLHDTLCRAQYRQTELSAGTYQFLRAVHA